MKWLLLYWFVGTLSLSCAQILPGYKNGSWWIITGEGATQLPVSITYLGNFDESGTAEFIENNRYGIIRANKEIVVSPTLYSITSIGKGLFECVDSTGAFVFDITTNNRLLQNVHSITRLNSSYAVVHQNDTVATILYLDKRTSFSYSDSAQILSSNWNTVFLQENDSLHVVFSPEGKQYVIPSANVEIHANAIVYTIDEETTLITSNFTRKFNQNPYLNFLPNYISFFENGKAHLLNKETGKIERIAPFEQISPAYFGGYFVTTKGKTGWMNDQGVLKIPAKYDQIYKDGKDYVVVNAELRGQYNEHFKLIVPVQFYSYYIHENLLYTTSILGYKGLYSLTKNRTILEPKYSILNVLNNSFVKAYYGKNIRVLELSEQHTVQSDVILENAITVKQFNFSPYDPLHRFDQRLLSLGWFFQPIENSNPQKYAWGLKTNGDSILIQPRSGVPIFVPNRHFSLLMEKRSTLNEPAHYSLRDFSTGKKVINLNVIGIDTVDCYSRAYVRMYSNGYKILLPNDSIKTIKYVGFNYGKYVPYCEGKDVEYSNTSGEEFVPVNQYLANGRFSNAYVWWHRRNKYNYQKFTDAKWNYLDSLGNDLFAEPFQFANEFKHERAIVKKNDKWGVIASDSVIIPFQYSEIKRISEFGDTLFLVKKNRGGTDLLDENAKNLGVSISSMSKSKGNLTMVSNGNKNHIYRNNQLEKTILSSFLLLGENEYAFREKKEYIIIGASGTEVGSTNFKPKKMIGDQLLIVEDKSKTGLAYLNGDTLFTPDKFTFEEIGIFIVKRGKSVNEVLSNSGSNIIHFTDEQLLIDPIMNTIALIKNNKIQLFDSAGKRIETRKLLTSDPITDFYAGCFFSASYIQSKEKTILLTKDISYKLFQNGYFAVLDSDNQIHVFKNGLEKVFSCQSKRITEIGAGIFAYQTREGLVIRRDDFEKQFPLHTVVDKNFSDGFCLLRTTKAFFFIDTTFEMVFNRTFMDATAFQNGFATVKLASGWTIIDKNGLQKAYPSFEKISQLGNGLFETPKKSIYGVVDGNGKEIVPCDFEKIEILPTGIIKVIKQGEIGYFNRNGMPIFKL